MYPYIYTVYDGIQFQLNIKFRKYSASEIEWRFFSVENDVRRGT